MFSLVENFRDLGEATKLGEILIAASIKSDSENFNSFFSLLSNGKSKDSLGGIGVVFIVIPMGFPARFEVNLCLLRLTT